MCRNYKEAGAREDIPQHVHLSNHPGYNLMEQQDFVQKYGDYVLRVLLMVKYGYFHGECEIPPLSTFNILWNCDPEVFGVDIETLIDLCPNAAIKPYLVVQDGGNVESNLNRFIGPEGHVYWMCQAHAQQYLDHEILERLQEFV
ncbi:hypothetical protein MVEG_01371 [Podila verticillata NRRL 6337]|nr:hypothetical protein MVEG_01371 [Podila verticillata NRRL 6337]